MKKSNKKNRPSSKKPPRKPQVRETAAQAPSSNQAVNETSENAGSGVVKGNNYTQWDTWVKIATFVGLIIEIISLIVKLPVVAALAVFIILVAMSARFIWLGSLPPILLSVLASILILAGILIIFLLPVTVMGTVFIDENGNALQEDGIDLPAKGLRVVLTDKNGIEHNTTTNEQGRFMVRGVPRERFTIKVSDNPPDQINPGFSLGPSVEVEVPVQPTPTGITPTPTPTATPHEMRTPVTLTSTSVPTTPTPVLTDTLTSTPQPTLTPSLTPTNTPTLTPTLAPPSFISPDDGDDMGCSSGDSCRITVEIQWVGATFTNGQILYVLVKPRPGSTALDYYIQPPPRHIGGGVWSVNNDVGLGSDSPNGDPDGTNYLVCAYVTTEILPEAGRLPESSIDRALLPCIEVFR